MVLSSKSLRAAAAAIAIGAAAATSAQAQLTANFYGLVFDVGTSNGGLLLLSEVAPPMNLNTLTLGSMGVDWDPALLNQGGSWGATINGCISVASTGQYFWNVESAESLYLYIDGNLVIGNGIEETGGFGGAFPSSNAAFLNMTGGLHTIEVRYLNVVGNDDSGFNYLDVQLPNGVVLSEQCPVEGVPEVGTVAATGLGAGLVLLTSLRRRKA